MHVAKRRLLIVDDDPDITLTLRTILDLQYVNSSDIQRPNQSQQSSLGLSLNKGNFDKMVLC